MQTVEASLSLNVSDTGNKRPRDRVTTIDTQLGPTAEEKTDNLRLWPSAALMSLKMQPRPRLDASIARTNEVACYLLFVSIVSFTLAYVQYHFRRLFTMPVSSPGFLTDVRYIVTFPS